MKRASTPSQTVGPFFRDALAWRDGAFVVPEGTALAFWVRGRVLDGDGVPVPDALVETWQCDPEGRIPHPEAPVPCPEGAPFRGFGRSLTEQDGSFAIYTVKPGRLPDGAGLSAPHIAVTLMARGLLDRLVTRIYFGDEAAANAEDAVLATVPAARVSTLVARAEGDGYRLDVRLQGERETVFFAI